jgi:glycosyltransferase involved in cell wall biosynthesis
MSADQLQVGLVGPIPPPNGGMAMQTQQLARLLRTENVDVRQVATNPPYRPAWIGRVRGLRALFRLVPYLWSVWRLAGRVDVIHMMANSGWSWQLYSAPTVWAGWLRRTPVIVNYRGGEAGSYLRNSFSRVKPTLDRVSVVVVPSGFLQDVFAEFGVETRVIPNIIDLERFRPRFRALEQESFNLVVTRNLEAIYGLDIAIKALGIARESIPSMRLKIAGSGPQLSELQELVQELHLLHNVEFVGRLGPAEIVSLYQSADGLLNPTTVDNMPNSVLEALACGVPVISTDVGGVPYIVVHESTALLVPAGDERLMADAMVRLCKDVELRRKLAAAGLAEVRQYAWPEVKGQWLDLYRYALKGQAA